MAKLQGPLMSVGAHGKLGGSLVYSRRKSNNIARGFHMPDKEITLKQWTQRHIIGLLTAHWQVKSSADKKVYEDLAKASGLQISGFNYFVKVAQADLYTHHGLCGYWSMNEESGAQVTDYSGNGNHGTLKPSYPSNCPIRVPAMIKQYGKALLFDGVDEYIDCGNDSSLDIISAITIEAWAKRSVVGVAHGIISRSDGYPHELVLRFDNTNKISLLIGDKANQDILTTADTYGTDWYHVVATWVNSTKAAKIYVNGNEKASDTLDYGIDTGGIDLFIGAQTTIPTTPFNGTIDEVRIYNRILGQSEIIKHYNLLRLNKQRQPLLIH